MKRVIGYWLLACFLVLLPSAVGAQVPTALGDNPKAMPYRYRVKQGKSVKVRSLPDVQKGERITSLEYPDMVYVDDDKTYQGSGYEWISASGGKGYVALQFLDKVDNPYYETPPVSQPVQRVDTDRAHNITKWILLVLTVIFTFVICKNWEAFDDIWSETFSPTPNRLGMRRMFVFKVTPYVLVLMLSLIIIVSILASVLSMLAVGGVVWLLLWIVKILLLVILWVGIIGCVLGIIATICGVWLAAIVAIIGGFIWACKDGIENFGNECVSAGLAFFEELNMITFTTDMFTLYWQQGLFIATLPMQIMLAFAVLALVFSLLVMVLEWCVTKYYNVKHPCPICNQPSEPAIYLSKGEKLPVRLRPGVYGLFHIKHPVTGEQMPTMLFNGRDRLPRECPHCHKIIRAKVGEEKHIAMIGLPGAGKSTLVYRMIGEMMGRYLPISFTDSVDPEVRQAVEYVKLHGRLENEVSKTATNERKRSIQLVVPRSGLLPYRLYINDVGGELFTKGGYNKEKMPFFSSVQSVLFLIDPFTAYWGRQGVSRRFAKWYAEKVGDIKDTSGKEELEDAFASLKNILEDNGNKPSNVHFNFVLVKKDTGYLQGLENYSDADLRNFLIEDMGLASEVSDVESIYASVRYFAVSAMESLPQSGIGPLYHDVMQQIKLKLER